jgi:hypothetical protein
MKSKLNAEEDSKSLLPITTFNPPYFKGER